jgi:hypothetical protein
MTMLANVDRLALEVLAEALDPNSAKSKMIADLHVELTDIKEEQAIFNRRKSREIAHLLARIAMV